MGRLRTSIDRRFPPREGELPLLLHVEHSLVGYVKGQALLSLIIGASAGIGLWLLGMLGCGRGHGVRALLFGAWVAFTELIPYLGPWLGAIPPFIYALVVDPVSAIWVALLFLGIHQIEGHIVVPKVMGTALRLHPLLVIFGLLAGRRDLRAARGSSWRCRCSRSCGRSGSSSPPGSSWSRGGPARSRCPSRSSPSPCRRLLLAAALAPVPAPRPPRILRPPRSGERRCSRRAASPAATAGTSPSSPTDLEVGPARSSRSSARTAPASRRCSRCSRARCRRATARRAPEGRARRLGAAARRRTTGG